MIKDSKMDFYSVASSRPFTHGQISWHVWCPSPTRSYARGNIVPIYTVQINFGNSIENYLSDIPSVKQAKQGVLLKLAYRQHKSRKVLLNKAEKKNEL